MTRKFFAEANVVLQAPIHLAARLGMLLTPFLVLCIGLDRWFIYFQAAGSFTIIGSVIYYLIKHCRKSEDNRLLSIICQDKWIYSIEVLWFWISWLLWLLYDSRQGINAPLNHALNLTETVFSAVMLILWAIRYWNIRKLDDEV